MRVSNLIQSLNESINIDIRIKFDTFITTLIRFPLYRN
jgi:hypothetical protein